MEIHETDINKSVVNLLAIKDKYKEIFEEANECLQHIHNKIYAIGAPLNDNCLKFNNAQLRWIKKIAEMCE